jgi:hypothetical protein
MPLSMPGLPRNDPIPGATLRVPPCAGSLVGIELGNNDRGSGAQAHQHVLGLSSLLFHFA